MSVVRVAVVGASGRMGRTVVRLVSEMGGEVVCAVGASDVGRDIGELAGVGALGVTVTDRMEAVADARAAVLVDFSLPSAFRHMAEVAAEANVAIVSGTTGLGDAETGALDAASRRVAALWEPNMSVGVHVLSALVGEAVRLLGEGFDIEIVEAHHGQKVDAPSGTAMRLAEVAMKAREGSTLVHGREGKPGARGAHEIGMHAVRGGDVIGDHTVMLLGQGERIELTHKASSRDLFARGAVRAALWLAGKAPGRYRLADVLAR